MAITLSQNNQVATLAIDRPAVHNALDPTTISELTATLQQLDQDHQVRVVVLTGNGKSFCAGADLAWMKKTAQLPEDENIQDALALAELMHTLDGLEKPTVAKVNGHAFGGGIGLICCCDIAVASDTAILSLSEVRLGLTPSVISPFVVAAIGSRQARRFFLTAEKQNAKEAQAIGLLHEVTAPDRLDEVVQGLVDNLLLGGPLAIKHAKALARQYQFSADQLAVLKRDTATTMGKLRVSAEGQEGFQAFLEKRKPDWA